MNERMTQLNPWQFAMFLIDATTAPLVPSFVGGAQPSVLDPITTPQDLYEYVIGNEGAFYLAFILGARKKLL